MKAVLLSVAFVVAVANASHFFVPQDITLPPGDFCPPCECSTTPKPCETPPTAPPRKCPDCVNQKCTPNDCDWGVQVPFPGDCFKFCKCAHGGAQEFDCPGGLHFNEVLQLCDWPENAHCTVPGTFLGGCEHLAPNF